MRQFWFFPWKATNEADLQLCFWEEVGNVYLSGLKEDTENNNIARALNPALNRWIKLLRTFYELEGEDKPKQEQQCQEAHATMTRSSSETVDWNFKWKKLKLSYSLNNQPNLNFMFFSSKVLHYPLWCSLIFHRQILPSLGWPGGMVCYWYKKATGKSKSGYASVILLRKPVLKWLCPSRWKRNVSLERAQI